MRNAKSKIWLLCVNFEKFASINEDRDQSQPSKRSTVIRRSSRLWSKFLDLNEQQPNFQEWLYLHSLSPPYNWLLSPTQIIDCKIAKIAML